MSKLTKKTGLLPPVMRKVFLERSEMSVAGLKVMVIEVDIALIRDAS